MQPSSPMTSPLGASQRIRSKWQDTGRRARSWSRLRFGGEGDLFDEGTGGGGSGDGTATLTPNRPRADAGGPSQPKASRSFARRLQFTDVLQNLVKMPAARKEETETELVPAGREPSSVQSESLRLGSISAAVVPVRDGDMQYAASVVGRHSSIRSGPPVDTVREVHQYIAFLLDNSQRCFQQQVWQRMPHPPPTQATPTHVTPSSPKMVQKPGSPVSPTGGDDVPTIIGPPRLGCIVPSVTVHEALLNTETARLSRTAFPGAFVWHSVSHGVEADSSYEVIEHLRVVASRAVRTVAADLLSRWRLDSEPNESSSTAKPVQGVCSEGRHSVSVVLHREGLMITLWRSRKAGKLYLRSVASLNNAVRCCQLPSAYQGVLATAIAMDGFLFTVTWLPPVLHADQPLNAQRPPSPLTGKGAVATQSASPVMDATMALLSVFLVREECTVGCVSAYATADTRILLVPDERYLRELQSCRSSFHFASMLFTHCLPAHVSPQQRLLLTLRSFVLSRELDFRKHLDRKTLLRDLFHACGAHMRMMLEVRSMMLIELSPEGLELLITSRSSREAASANVSLVVNLMLSECVARTLKAMILGRVGATISFSAPSSASTLALDLNGDPQAEGGGNTTKSPWMAQQKVCEIATDVLRRFATSEKFFHQSLLPAVAKKFPVGFHKSIGDGLVFDRNRIQMSDIVGFLQHRLGIVFDANTKTFVPQSSTEKTRADSSGDPMGLTLGGGRSSSAAQLMWSTAYGVDAVVDVALPGIQSVSLKGRSGPLSMLSCELYAETIGAFVRRAQAMHPAAVSCGLMLSVYFGQVAVEIKTSGAWPTSLSATDIRAFRQREVNALCITTLTIMHDFVQQWIVVHRVIRNGTGATSVPAQSRPTTPDGTSLFGGLSDGGDVVSGTMSEFRPCGVREEATFLNYVAPLPLGALVTADVSTIATKNVKQKPPTPSTAARKPTAGQEGRWGAIPSADIVWTLHVCGHEGAPVVFKHLGGFLTCGHRGGDDVNANVSASALSASISRRDESRQRYLAKAVQVMHAWAVAICSSRIRSCGDSEETDQWCCAVGSSCALDFVRAYRTLLSTLDDQGSPDLSTRMTLSSSAHADLAAALAVCVALLGASRFDDRHGRLSMDDDANVAMSLNASHNPTESFSVPESSIDAVGPSPLVGGTLLLDTLQWAVDNTVLRLACTNRLVPVVAGRGSTEPLLLDAVVDIALRLPPDDARGWLLLLLACPAAQLPWMKACCANILLTGFQKEFATPPLGTHISPGLALGQRIASVLSRSLALLHLIPRRDPASAAPNSRRSSIQRKVIGGGRRVKGSSSATITFDVDDGHRSTTDFEVIRDRLQDCKQVCEELRHRDDERKSVEGAQLGVICSSTTMWLCAELDQLRCIYCFRQRSAARFRRPQAHYSYSQFADLQPAGSSRRIAKHGGGSPSSSSSRMHSSQQNTASLHEGVPDANMQLPKKSNKEWIVLKPMTTLVKVDATAITTEEAEDRRKIVELEETKSFHNLMDMTLATRRVAGINRTQPVLTHRPSLSAQRHVEGAAKALCDAEGEGRQILEHHEGHERFQVDGWLALQLHTLSDAAFRRHLEVVTDGELYERDALAYAEAECFAIDIEAPHRNLLKRWRATQAAEGGREDTSWVRRGFGRCATQPATPVTESLPTTAANKPVAVAVAPDVSRRNEPKRLELRPVASKRIDVEERNARRALYEAYDVAMEYIGMQITFDDIEIQRAVVVRETGSIADGMCVWGPIPPDDDRPWIV
jgi:hypothetical protein